MTPQIDRRTAFIAVVSAYTAARTLLPAKEVSAARAPMPERSNVSASARRALALGNIEGDAPPDDQRLATLARSWNEIESRLSRMARVAEARYDCAPEDAPFSDRYETLCHRQTELEREMIATPARTAAGVAMKARVAQSLSQQTLLDDPPDVAQRLDRSLRADLIRLTAGQ